MKSIFIVGSKPDAAFPDVEPDLIYAANGAIARVENYKAAFKVCVLNRYAFSRGWVNVDAKALGKADKLVIIGNDYHVVKNNIFDFIGGFDAEVEFDGKEVSRAIKLKQISLNEVLLAHLFTKVNWMRRLRKYRMNAVLGHNISTGAYALGRAVNDHGFSGVNYYLIGIGVGPDSSHFNDSDAAYNNFHSAHDFVFLRSIAKRASLKVTDTSARELVERSQPGVPKNLIWNR